RLLCQVLPSTVCYRRGKKRRDKPSRLTFCKLLRHLRPARNEWIRRGPWLLLWQLGRATGRHGLSLPWFSVGEGHRFLYRFAGQRAVRVSELLKRPSAPGVGWPRD